MIVRYLYQISPPQFPILYRSINQFELSSAENNISHVENLHAVSRYYYQLLYLLVSIIDIRLAIT